MPTIAEVYHLAMQNHQNGHLAQAAALYQQILQTDPGNANVLNNLGIIYFGQKDLRRAAECFWRATQSNPIFADAHNNLGSALKLLGRVEDASACYRQTLALNPNHADAVANLGLVLKDQGQWTEAIQCFQQALLINPRNADALNNLGVAYQGQGQLSDALACHRQALALNPHHADAHNCLGHALLLQGDLPGANACYRQALRLDVNHAEAHHNLGMVLLRQGQLAEAADCFQQALHLEPTHKKALWNFSFLRLLRGDLEGGWPGFLQREALSGMVSPFVNHPRWDGSSLEGKAILVYAEPAWQGLGDTLQFVRYLPFIKRRGGTVVLKCQPALTGLLTGFPGVDHLVQDEASLPLFDVQVPLFHLPAVFRTTLATIPADIPYLSADPRLVERWQQEMKRAAQPMPAVAVGTPLNIGIVWQGSMTNKDGDHRSASLSCFEPLARINGVVLWSLQVGPGTEQLAAAPFPITDLGNRFDPHSLNDLAAAMMHLDLVATVDTAVAHLAGALGIPVWVALESVPDWRWLLDRPDSPWYPTMRLYRQRKPDDWTEVFERIANEIRLISLGSKNQGS